jgi:transcriptional regulator
MLRFGGKTAPLCALLRRKSALACYSSIPKTGRMWRICHSFFLARTVSVFTWRAATRYLDGAEALFVINGPDGYISPDWYGAPDQVPTWNYVAVELVGSARKMDEAELIAQSDALSYSQELKLTPKPVWTRAKMTDGLFEKMLRGIYGFEMHVTTWRSTLKLGQNKSDAMREAAANGAAAAGNIAIADAMRNLPE